MNKLMCGVDLGGTKLKVGIVDPKGHVIDMVTVYDHVKKSEELVVEQIALLIKKLLKQNHLEESVLMGIGVGVAGHLRFRDGILITTSNFKGFKNYPLRQKLQEFFRVPLLIDNDANAQAFGEFKYGGGKNYRSMIFMTISTGIGAGIILDGRVYRGMTGTAGEIGHTIIDPGSELTCTCGNAGCLMSVACGMALPHLFRKRIRSGMKTRLEFPDDFDLDQIDGKWLKKGLDIGDPLSREVVLQCADYIGIGLYNIFQIFNPPLILLGGGLMKWGPIYLDRIRETFYKYVKDMIFDPIEISESVIGADAGMIGAAALLLE
jgi:glucokinase